MTRITVKEAAKELNMSILTLQMLLREGRIPIGYSMLNPGRQRHYYIIYKELVDKFKQSVEAGDLCRTTSSS